MSRALVRFANTRKGEKVLFIISLVKYSRYGHVFGRINVDFDDDGAVDIFLRTWRRVFASNSASLIKHMRGHTTLVATDENLKSSEFVVTGYLENRGKTRVLITVSRRF